MTDSCLLCYELSKCISVPNHLVDDRIMLNTFLLSSICDSANKMKFVRFQFSPNVLSSQALALTGLARDSSVHSFTFLKALSVSDFNLYLSEWYIGCIPSLLYQLYAIIVVCKSVFCSVFW